MSHQQEKFASLIKKELGIFLLKNFPHDPEVFVSAVNVLVDGSAETAKVYISVFPRGRAKEVEESIKRYGGEARKYLSFRIKRRKVPKIIFVLANPEDEERLEKLLEKVKNE